MEFAQLSNAQLSRLAGAYSPNAEFDQLLRDQVRLQATTPLQRLAVGQYADWRRAALELQRRAQAA